MTENVQQRIPAVITFLVASSAVTFFSVWAAFWAILLGLALIALLKQRNPFKKA
jgi:predicted benzoate:H+ symporter BenE